MLAFLALLTSMSPAKHSLDPSPVRSISSRLSCRGCKHDLVVKTMSLWKESKLQCVPATPQEHVPQRSNRCVWFCSEQHFKQVCLAASACRSAGPHAAQTADVHLDADMCSVRGVHGICRKSQLNAKRTSSSMMQHVYMPAMLRGC